MEKKYSKKQYKNFLAKIHPKSKSCDCCLLNEYLTREQPSVCMFVQIKCIELLRLDLIKSKGKNVLWKEALNIWIERGLASLFREKYNLFVPKDEIENLNINKFYKNIVGEIE